jgi:hypothetical protein
MLHSLMNSSSSNNNNNSRMALTGYLPALELRPICKAHLMLADLQQQAGSKAFLSKSCIQSPTPAQPAQPAWHIKLLSSMASIHTHSKHSPRPLYCFHHHYHHTNKEGGIQWVRKDGSC